MTSKKKALITFSLKELNILKHSLASRIGEHKQQLKEAMTEETRDSIADDLVSERIVYERVKSQLDEFYNNVNKEAK